MHNQSIAYNKARDSKTRSLNTNEMIRYNSRNSDFYVKLEEMWIEFYKHIPLWTSSVFKKQTSLSAHPLIILQVLRLHALFSSWASFGWKGSCSTKMLTKCHDEPFCGDSSAAISGTFRSAHVSGSAPSLGFDTVSAMSSEESLQTQGGMTHRRWKSGRKRSYPGLLLWTLRHRTCTGLVHAFMTIHCVHCSHFSWLKLGGFYFKMHMWDKKKKKGQ